MAEAVTYKATLASINIGPCWNGVWARKHIFEIYETHYSNLFL